MTTKRPRLTEMTLTGPRALLRRALGWALGGIPLVAAIGYLLPAHQLHGDAAHSNYADGGIASLLVLLAACGFALTLRRRRFGAGMLSGGIAIGAAVGALAPVLLVHLFANMTTTYGEGVFAVGIIGLFCSGVALVLGEPILYLLERRKLMREREPEPALPAARLVHG